MHIQGGCLVHYDPIPGLSPVTSGSMGISGSLSFPIGVYCESKNCLNPKSPLGPWKNTRLPLFSIPQQPSKLRRVTSQVTQLSGVPGFQSRTKTLSPEVVSTPDLGSPRAVLTVDIRVEGVEKVVVEECLKQVHLGRRGAQ